MKKLFLLAVFLIGCSSGVVTQSGESSEATLSSSNKLVPEEVERDCGEDKGECVTLNVDVPEGYSVGRWSQIFNDGADQYFSVQNDETEEFCVFKNDELYFCDAMDESSGPPIVEASRVLGEPVFTYTAPGEPDHLVYETYYGGEFLNEKFNSNSSYHLFEYDGKFGFIAYLNTGIVIVFDEEIIETPFSSIRIYTCCALFPHAFSISEEGILSIGASSNGESFKMEIDLN